MGCFLSKKRPTKADNKECGGASLPAAPPPPPEEEAVKEVVLSETPILRKPTLIEDDAVWEPPANHELKVDTPPAEITQKESTAPEFKPCGEDFISQVSDQSDLYSYTESLSTTTTVTATAPEKRDDGEEVTQRSPLKPRRKRPNNGEIVIGARERNVRSPARRPGPSPEKRKLVQQGRGMAAVPRRNLGSRREGGEVPAQRRSRSPVTRGNVMYKSPAGRNVIERSPARAVENSHREARAVENSGGKSDEVESDGVLAESSSKMAEKQKDNEEERETLENPLVSLECFIFL